MFNNNPKEDKNEFTDVNKKYIKDLAIFLWHFGYKEVVLSVQTKDGKIKGIIAPVKYY